MSPGYFKLVTVEACGHIFKIHVYAPAEGALQKKAAATTNAWKQAWHRRDANVLLFLTPDPVPHAS